MKILHIIPSLSMGGAERITLDIVIALNKQENIDCHLVLLHDAIEYDISEIKDKVQVIPAGIALSVWRKNNLNVTLLQKFIDEFKPDIIHSHLFEAEIVSRSITYPKAKWFSHFHDNINQLQNFSLNTLFNKKLFVNFFEKRYLFKRYKANGGNNFIAISQDSFEYAQQVCRQYPITLLPNAINVQRFYNKNIRQLDKLRIINVGSFVENKNQQLLVQIGDELSKNNIDFELCFLGNGPEKDKLQKICLPKSYYANIHFEGNVENVYDYLNKANVYVHTAKKEAFGLVLLEAMASGLPVIALDGKGNRDLIVNGENGFLIEEENPEEFVDKILFLIKSPEKYQKTSAYASNYAKNYDISTYIDNVLTMYETS